jgi:hypothetical protein
MNREELKLKYKEHANKKNVDIQRYTIFPIGIESTHNGRRVTFTKKAAEKVVSDLKDMPVMYVNGELIPSKHRDSEGNRNVIGTSIGGGIFTDEKGVEWAYADVLIYTDANKKIYETIKDNSDKLGSSIEAVIDIDNEGNIHNAEYEGLSILNNDKSAWRTELLVAEKGDPIEVKYDDILTSIVGKDYNEKLSEKEKSIDELKKQLEDMKAEYDKHINEKEGVINELRKETDSLRDMNKKFSKLVG